MAQEFFGIFLNQRGPTPKPHSFVDFGSIILWHLDVINSFKSFFFRQNHFVGVQLFHFVFETHLFRSRLFTTKCYHGILFTSIFQIEMDRLFGAIFLQWRVDDGSTETENERASASFSAASQPKSVDRHIRVPSRDHRGRGVVRMVQPVRIESLRQTEIQELRVRSNRSVRLFIVFLHSLFRRVYSMPSALWAMWGLLCGALVNFKAPKSWPNKFLINVWGGFCVIFVASYTANIAALIASLLFQNAQLDINDRNVSTSIQGKRYGKINRWYFRF